MGYIKGNVQVISQLANSMKGSAAIKDLLQFAKWITNTYATDGSLIIPLKLDAEFVPIKKTKHTPIYVDDVLFEGTEAVMQHFKISHRTLQKWLSMGKATKGNQ